ncbi:MAG: nuclear transport factor 2 family protein [Reyranella sp.]|nr:nuclear transport factor 2 family protein [Reyranella sp.]
MTPQEMTPEDETASFAIPQAIAEALQRYIDGARTGSIDLLRSAFTPEARVSGSYSGKPVSWTLQEFCDAVAKGGAAPSLEARVISMEYSGDAAMAHLEALNWRGTRYTDFFVLVRGRDGWRVDSKVFFAHLRA